MIKKLIFLSCLFSSCLFANESQNINQVGQIGRYQLTATENEVYLLETDTGKIWMSKKTGSPSFNERLSRWYRQKLELPQDRTQ